MSGKSLKCFKSKANTSPFEIQFQALITSHKFEIERY